jgi:predicted Rossmann fold nucleotide-binding protein DprA/Smf involved in DNA uptake
MTLSKEEKQRRNALLKELREKHASSIELTRERLKEQKAIRRQICQVMRAGPKTVPEIAEASSLPAHEVLWQITAMKKYDLVVEVGQCGEYYQYAMAEEAK